MTLNKGHQDAMLPERIHEITARYSQLRIAIIGDFCLDRYLEIDPERAETSLETGLGVHNVVRVRAQPGAAGTILNNLVALGIGTIPVVGFCGDDGEGYELRRELAARPGVNLEGFLTSDQRRTFTYCKPLVVSHQAPRELNRLDSKNWTPTPPELQSGLVAQVARLTGVVDAIIVLDQVDLAETGVVTTTVRNTIAELQCGRQTPLILADSRRGLADFPPLGFKMNALELGKMTGGAFEATISAAKRQAEVLCRRTQRPVFVTLAEQGIVGVLPGTEPAHVAAHPVRGPIDIVGAGDAVMANLTAALAAGAILEEAMSLAMTAASLVIHQLGTTGTASVAQLREFRE